MRARMILVEALLQRAQHLALVLFLRHINKINNDDATQVAQTQLAGNGLRCLEIGFENGLFQVAMTDITAGVHIRRRHRLGLVKNEVATGFQLYLAIQRLLDFVFNAVDIENRAFTRIVLNTCFQFRHEAYAEFLCTLVTFPRIDADLLNTTVQHVPHHPNGQRQIIINNRSRLRVLLSFFH